MNIVLPLQWLPCGTRTPLTHFFIWVYVNMGGDLHSVVLTGTIPALWRNIVKSKRDSGLTFHVRMFIEGRTEVEEES